MGIPFKGQLTCLSCVTGERRLKSFVQTSARSSNPCLSSQKQTCPAPSVRFGEVRFEATFQWPCVAASASEVSGPQTFQAALPRSYPGCSGGWLGEEMGHAPIWESCEQSTERAASRAPSPTGPGRGLGECRAAVPSRTLSWNSNLGHSVT